MMASRGDTGRLRPADGTDDDGGQQPAHSSGSVMLSGSS